MDTWEENQIDCQEQADRITRLEEEVDRLSRHDCDSIIAYLRRKLDEHKERSETLESVEKQLGELQEKYRVQQGTTTALREHYEIHQITIERLKEDCKVYKAENDELKKQCTAHGTTIETLQQECRGYSREINDLRAQLAEPDLHHRCEENVASLEKQLELQRSAMGQKAPPEPVMAENMALKKVIKQVDRDVVSLCTNLRNAMASLQRPEEIKDKHLWSGHRISNRRQSDIMRQTETNNSPASLQNLAEEALFSDDIIPTYHTRMTDILNKETEAAKVHGQAMQSLQKRHDMFKQNFSTLLGRAEEEEERARTRETKLWEMIELRDDMIQLREEIVVRLLECLSHTPR